MSSTSPRQGLSKTLRSIKARFIVGFTLVLLSAVFSASALTANLNAPLGPQAGSLAASVFSFFSGNVGPLASATPPAFDRDEVVKDGDIVPNDHDPLLEASVAFSGNTTGGPTFTRGTCASFTAQCVPTSTATNGPHAYQVTSFTVSTSGAYQIDMFDTGAPAWDTHASLYQGSFDPNSPLVNAVQVNDDNGVTADSRLNVNLTAGTTYFFVASGFSSANFGQYGVTIVGPGVISLAGCAAPPADMVAWYPAESGTSVADIIGDPPNNGTYQGTAQYSNAVVGNGFNLNGASTIQVPSSAGLNVGAAGGFSIDAWINPTNNTAEPIVEWNTNTGAGPLTGIGVHFWHSFPTGNDLYLNVVDTAGMSHAVSVNDVVTTGTFQHVAVTYNKATGDVVFYVNGVNVGGGNVGTGFTPQTGAGYSMYIGGRTNGGGSPEFFTGIVDEVEIFSRALTGAEVASIANAGANGKCHVSFLQFDTAAQNVNENAGTVTVTVKRVGANDTTATANVSTANGTATTPADYGSASVSVVTFSPGERTQTYTIPIVDDNIDETNETFTTSLSMVTGTGASLGTPSTQTITILDNDAVSNVTVANASGVEGTPPGAGGTATHVVTKTGPSVFPSSVTYSFVDVTATGGATCAAGVDYINTGGTLTFPASLTTDTQNIVVQFCPDSAVEGDETYTVVLTPSGAAPQPTVGANATGTIQDDDSTVQFTMANYSVTEGNAARPATTTATFVVSRTGTGSALPAAQVDASTIGTVAAPVATGGFLDCTGANSDYVIVSGQTLTWAAGDTTNKNFNVLVCQDTIVEANENFPGDLSNPIGTSIGAQGTATMTITNDDGAAIFNFSPTSTVTQAEGTTFTFPVVRTFTVASTTGSDLASTVAVGITGVSGNPPFPATPGSGSTADVIASTSVTFAAGSGNTANASITTNNDTLFEPDEQFRATLTSVSSGNGSIGANNTRDGIITDNDPAPVFRIAADVSQIEGNAGQTAMIFTVEKVSGDAQYPQTVRVFTTDGGGGGTPATAPTDYTAIPAGANGGDPVVFTQGQTSAQFAVIINGDVVFEDDETFTVTIGAVTIQNAACPTNPNPPNTGANPPCFATSIGSPASRIGTILNDDAAPTFAISPANVNVTEGDTGTVNATFTITKTGLTELSSIVSASTVDGPTASGIAAATGGTDYVSLNNAQVATFAPGDTTKTFNVVVNGDTIYELNERFTVNLVNVTNGTFSGATSATGTIVNDEDIPNFTFAGNNLTPTEGSAATATVTLVFPAGTTGTEVAIPGSCNSVVISGDSSIHAQSGDMSTTSQSISFAAGSANGATTTCTRNTTQDTVFEGPETFSITLTGSAITGGGTPGVTGSPLTATIVNDDACSFVVSNVSQAEGNAGTSNFVHTVTKSCGTGTFNAFVNYAGTDGTAVAPVDYTQIIPGQLNFTPATTVLNLPVSVNGDLTVEPDETYNVCITNSAACPSPPLTLGATVNGVNVPNGACGVATCGLTNGVGTILNDDGVPISISGTITNFGGGAAAGVTVNLTGSATATTTTNASGAYSFTNLPSGGNYMVTPVPPAGTVASPTNRTFTGITSSQTNQNFVLYQAGAIPRTLNVVNGYTNPGSPVTVPITLTAQGDEASLSFSLSYNAAILSNPTVACGVDSGAGCILLANTSVPGQIGISVDPQPGAPQNGLWAAGTRQVVTVTFNTGPTAAPNTPITFTDVPTLRRTADAGSNPLPTVYNNGFVVFAQGLESDVAPRPTGDGSVVANDVVQTRRFVTALDTPNPANNEFQRADSAPAATRGDGQLGAPDVIQARRYSAGLDPVQPAGGPFQAVVVAPNPEGVARDFRSENVGRVLRILNATGSPGSQVNVCVEIDSQGDEAAVQTTVNFDPTRLSISGISSPSTNPDVTLGTGVAAGTSLTVNGTQVGTGRIGFLIDSSNTLAQGTRQLVCLRFTIAANAPPGLTPVTFGNTPVPQSLSDAQGNPLTASNETGNVNVLGPTAAGVSVSGRVTTPTGAGLRGATVTIIDAEGNRQTATTSTFGYYQFDNVEAGATYVIAVASRRFRFTPRSVQVVDSLTDVDFMGQE